MPGLASAVISGHIEPSQLHNMKSCLHQELMDRQHRPVICSLTGIQTDLPLLNGSGVDEAQTAGPYERMLNAVNPTHPTEGN